MPLMVNFAGLLVDQGSIVTNEHADPRRVDAIVDFLGQSSEVAPEQRLAVLMVGTVQCQPLDVAQLPADIRQQARVAQLLGERALIRPGRAAQRGQER